MVQPSNRVPTRRIQCQRWPFFAPLVALLVVCMLFGFYPSKGEASRRPGESKKRGAAKVALIELGRRLFFEPLVSRSGERSCASCHDPYHGYSDPSQFSDDDVGMTIRHSQTLINVSHSSSVHWDGEFESIEQLVTARIGLPTIIGRRRGYANTTPTTLSAEHSALGLPEHIGMTSAQKLEAVSRLTLKLSRLPRAQDRLERAGRYKEAVLAVFGDVAVTRARVAKALGAYCRTIASGPAVFDQRNDARAPHWSASAQRGFELFKGRAGCAQCHVVKGARGTSKQPLFSDYAFHNTGVAWLDRVWKEDAELHGSDMNAKRDARHALAARITSPTDSLRPGFDDPGRSRISTRRNDDRNFKTPTLRDVAGRGPYMHNGMFPTLHDVVRYYAQGGSADPEQDRRIKPFVTSERDIDDLVAFLGTLTSRQRPGLARKPYRHRRKHTELRFVNASGQPLRGIVLSLVPVGDDLPVELGVKRNAVRTLTTNQQGRVTFEPAATTHVRLQLEQGYPPPRDGALVPDSCRSATVQIPVSGSVELDLHCYDEAFAPEQLIATHVGVDVFPGHERPRSYFKRVRTIRVGDIKVAKYIGQLRSDVPPEVEFVVPGTKDVLPVTLRRGGPLTLDTRITRPSALVPQKAKK